MSKFAFVILHFNAVGDTIECIDSIFANMAGTDFDIIVVDNASPDGSGAVLAEKYADERRVKVILNAENSGFSRGNNIGFVYAKKHLAPDFIVMLNNDTLLLQPDFAGLVEKEYARSGFALMGPLVETPGADFGSNPTAMKDRPAAHYLLHIIKVCHNQMMTFLGLESVYQRLKAKLRPRSAARLQTEGCREVKENVELHGCFWIFGRPYIDRFDGIEASTFLYGEEPMLFHRLKINGLKSVYQPGIHVYHKEDRSTNTMHSTPRNKKLFRNRLAIKADWAIIRNRLTEKPL